MEKDEEGEVQRQKKLLEDKKRTVSYLKSRVEELERSMAQNYVKGHFTLAAQDSRRLAAVMDVLADIDITS